MGGRKGAEGGKRGRKEAGKKGEGGIRRALVRGERSGVRGCAISGKWRRSSAGRRHASSMVRHARARRAVHKAHRACTHVHLRCWRRGGKAVPRQSAEERHAQLLRGVSPLPPSVGRHRSRASAPSGCGARGACT